MIDYLSIRYSLKLEISRQFRGRLALTLKGTTECIFPLKCVQTGPSLSRDHQNSNNNDSLLSLFDSLWRMKANYRV